MRSATFVIWMSMRRAEYMYSTGMRQRSGSLTHEGNSCGRSAALGMAPGNSAFRQGSR